MQKNGGAGQRHTAATGTSNGSANGTTNGSLGNTNGRSSASASGSNSSSRSGTRSLSPVKKSTKSAPPHARTTRNGSGAGEPRTSSPSSFSSSPHHNHRRISLEEGIELSREPWRQGEVGPGWESVENEEVGVVMGGSSSRSGGGSGSTAGYKVVEREEPLLGDEEAAPNGEVKQPQDQRFCRVCVLGVYGRVSYSTRWSCNPFSVRVGCRGAVSHRMGWRQQRREKIYFVSVPVAAYACMYACVVAHDRVFPQHLLFCFVLFVLCHVT